MYIIYLVGDVLFVLRPPVTAADTEDREDEGDEEKHGAEDGDVQPRAAEVGAAEREDQGDQGHGRDPDRLRPQGAGRRGLHRTQVAAYMT